jgi:5-methylcytosine-specific restriction endonuclease McrA
MTGEKHPNWQGGKTLARTIIRHSFENRQWRKAVFERDGYPCQFCGERGKKLNADHIKPFALYPELRFELSNGRTLCVECHKKTPTYLLKRYHK